MARRNVASKAEAEHRQEIHERRHDRDDHHQRKTLVIKADALPRPDGQELDHRQDEQVADEGDESPAMALSEFPRHCGGR